MRVWAKEFSRIITPAPAPNLPPIALDDIRAPLHRALDKARADFNRTDDPAVREFLRSERLTMIIMDADEAERLLGMLAA